MNRITGLMEIAEPARKLFCAFLTAGIPSLSGTKRLVHGFEKMGVDILELAFPFSDPLADGPVIQRASCEAIRRGVRMKDCFSLMAQLRNEGVKMPVIFFSYFNPIFDYGFDRFIHDVKKSGFDGVICPDLPYGVEPEFVAKLRGSGIAFIQLVAPNTPLARRRQILAATDGFAYYVSRKGITGFRARLSQGIEKEVKALKHISSKKILVGFGISTPAQVKRITGIADGAIVGSAIMAKLLETKSIEKTLAYTARLVLAVQYK